jgi:hypothetical protein
MSKVKPMGLTENSQARCSNKGGIPAEKKNFSMKNRFFLSKQFFYRTFAG